MPLAALRCALVHGPRSGAVDVTAHIRDKVGQIDKARRVQQLEAEPVPVALDRLIDTRRREPDVAERRDGRLAQPSVRPPDPLRRKASGG
jgi:hypothetical protein